MMHDPREVLRRLLSAPPKPRSSAALAKKRGKDAGKLATTKPRAKRRVSQQVDK